MSEDEHAEERRTWLQTALVSYQRAVELEPHSPFHRYGLAQVHLALRDSASAEAELRRAIEEEPNFLPCRVLLAVVYNARGEKERASDQFREIVERQQRFAQWVKDPLEQQFLNADATALAVTLRGSGTGA
jgi:predicted Zn-dependent protease